MRVCIIGTGYVGLVVGACLADAGNYVYCVDIDEDKIAKLRRGILPIYEPGLDEIVKWNIYQSRLYFTTKLKEAIANSFFIFVTVGTPLDANGNINLQQVLQTAQDIGAYMEDEKIIVVKSTVPVGTTKKIKEIIEEELLKRGKDNIYFDVAFCPEFLREGSAIDDFLRPDRIIIGAEDNKMASRIKELLLSCVKTKHEILTMSTISAELTKYAANSMLATRISFMNELARLCDKVGADIEEVRLGIGTDRRIGSEFLRAGIGYGGSCLPKDVKALIKTAREKGVKLSILQAVDKANDIQKDYVYSKIHRYFNGCIEGVRIALWGLSFKPNTDDVRESQGVAIAKRIIEKGGVIQAFDPVAVEKTRSILGEGNIVYCNDCYEALRGADTLVVTTEWEIFRQPNFYAVKELLMQPVIFDCRNLYDPLLLKKLGFIYFGIGRGDCI